MEKYSKSGHPNFEGVLLVLDLFKEGAVAASEAARRKLARTRGQRRGLTLRSGAETPLWNILAGALNAECKTHGAKAALARCVGLPRQRMHDFLRGGGGGAMPDAERTLMLLQWLAGRRQPGAQVAQSATGVTGATGATGGQGGQGAASAQRVQGATSAQRVQGAAGAASAAGVAGVAGAANAAGASGAQKAQRVQRVQRWQRVQGAQRVGKNIRRARA